MKRIFAILLWLSVVVNVVGQAWDYSDNVLTIFYNTYGDKDDQGHSIQWGDQAGEYGKNILIEAVYDANGNAAWTPALGDWFTITISGVSDETGIMQFVLIDDREDVNYWGAWSNFFEFDVTKGEAFHKKFNLIISNLTQTNTQNPSYGQNLVSCGLYVGFKLSKNYEESDKSNERIITDANLSVTYHEAKAIAWDDIFGNYMFYQGSLVGYLGEETEIILPNNYNGVNYTIGENAFQNCSFSSITIPNTVISIGNSAFEGCADLTSVILPEAITTIPYRAFYGCSKLSSVTIPQSVTSIKNSAFYGCSSLKSITIPQSVTEIGSSAFYGCSKLESVVLPENITSIEDHVLSVL